MTKTHRKAASSAEESFNKHYAAIWGEERWRDSLYPALLMPTRYACMLNRYASLDAAKQLIRGPDQDVVPLSLPKIAFTDAILEEAIDLMPHCFIRTPKLNADGSTSLETPFPVPLASPDHLQTHWNLDAASVLVSHLLNVRHGDSVLDLCAAPGGKSIALAQNLWLHYHADNSEPKSTVLQQRPVRSGTLHSNESDGPRQKRLADNLKAYLPKQLHDNRYVTALRVDGTNSKAEYELRVRTASGTTAYDKVLVDAPCSSERHIIHAHSRVKAGGRVVDEMANWRPGSSKRLAETQLKLLMAGLRAAKLGGTIMYATCSIEPTENDGVVEKMLSQVEKERRKGAKWSIKVGFNAGIGDEALEARIEKTWAERSKHGWIVLPDHPSGGRWGPLFFAVLTKVEG